MEDLKEKTVVITGGATGIDFALAKAFGAEGARVVLAEPRLNRLRQSVANLEEQNIEASYCQCDVADPESVRALADEVWRKNGQVDVLR